MSKSVFREENEYMNSDSMWKLDDDMMLISDVNFSLSLSLKSACSMCAANNQ